ncbi:hypothetical protein [Thiothrix subterranea]|uniref:Uncharacterized protein n=1 Tax=Thiothrix subterranea TaxID=2735563 RepID=A0AA51R0V2_9GAMM|nr:hypothetical protein [Thiothrix subterranea]MDQ5769024.1 hypothetical protein [Thiothrix subterranea]WML88417.1 hypothetical protein RCG00_08545 [Thiothrix subterranea]
MQFSDDDLKMIEWLRKQHANWPGVRMIILVCSILTMVLAGWLLFSGDEGYSEALVLYVVLAAAGMSYTLGSWAGRAEISLLLKLVEAQQIEKKYI